MTVMRRMPVRIEIQLRFKLFKSKDSAGWLFSWVDLRLFFLVFVDKADSCGISNLIVRSLPLKKQLIYFNS